MFKKTKYKWWNARIKSLFQLYDILRIDHFRGFDEYYAVPYGDETAENGKWRQGPGIEFFKAIREKMGELPIIAEDLGTFGEDVIKLLEDTNFPGMRVIQFGFDPMGDSTHLPHNYPKNSVAYVGTHDNDTIMGYMTKTASRKTRKRAKDYLRLTRKEGYNWGMMKAIWSSNSDTAIVTMQDLLGLGNEARMNYPSTVKDNWQWRAKPDYITEDLTEKLRYYTNLYQRIPKKKRVK